MDYPKLKDVIKNADAYKQIGKTEIYIELQEFPVEKTEKIEKGGSHRLDIATSVWLYATVSGLSLRSSFDIEGLESNGKGYYEIDVVGCKDLMGKLPLNSKTQFKEYIFECAKAVEKKGREYQDYADKQFKDASLLKDIANTNKEAQNG